MTGRRATCPSCTWSPIPATRAKYTLPLLWDIRRSGSSPTTRADHGQFETEFTGYHRPGSPDLYPAAQRREIDAIATLIYYAVNNGVYKAGLATTQAEYEEAFDALFTTLDALDERLARRRFLLGGSCPRRTCGCSRRWPGSMLCTTRCSSATCTGWLITSTCGATPAISTSGRVLAIPPTSIRSSATTIRRRAGSTRAGIVPKGPYVSWLEPHGQGPDFRANRTDAPAGDVRPDAPPGSLAPEMTDYPASEEGDVRRVC